MNTTVIAILLTLFGSTTGPPEGNERGLERVIIDFSNASAWSSIDDVVMGGVSRSEMTVENGVATFRGVLSLENNGGFASVRSRPADYDLSGFNGVVVRVKGDGRSYKLRLRLTSSFDGVSYEAPLEPSAGEWEDVVISFDAFRPVYRGRLVRDAPPLDPAGIKTFGVMIADKQDGPFRLEVASITGTE